MRIFYAALSLLALVGAPSLTLAKTGPESAAASYIQSLGDQALAVIKTPGLAKDRKQEELSKLFSDNVDFDWVGKFVMGRFWRQATDDQKARYLKNYRAFLTKNYTSRFTEYTSGTFRVIGARNADNGEYVVGMQLLSEDASEQPVLVEYKVRKNGASFRVFDIVVEGVSMITTQRAEFGSVLNQKGIDVLIEQLDTK